MTQHYTFGTTQRAAERLHHLADAFDPSSGELLSRHSPGRLELAVDLGAGIGRTTLLLHQHAACGETIGLETSEHFLAQARRSHAVPSVRFIAHDVTRAPFPTAAPNLLYSRFLLTHLPNPTRVVETWRHVAAPGAWLFSEETATLEAEDASIARYYELVARMQQHYGQCLSIGRHLEGYVREAGWSVFEARIRRIELPAPVMARLHAMNIATWKLDPFAQSAFDQDELLTLEACLGQIANGAVHSCVVVCHLAQVVARRP